MKQQKENWKDDPSLVKKRLIKFPIFRRDETKSISGIRSYNRSPLFKDERNNIRQMSW